MLSEPALTTIIVALIGGIPSTIMAIAAYRKGRENGRKTDEIHILVNSNLTKVKAELAEAKQTIRRLEQVLARWDQPGDAA